MAVYRNRSREIAQRLVKLRDYLFVNATPNHAVKASDILEYLNNSGGIEVENIKTLYRDIKTLKNFLGLEIEYDKHNKGYILKNPPFEPHELRMIANSIQAAKFITQQEADRLTDKIMHMLADKDTRSSLKRRTLVKNRVHAINEKAMKGLDTIYEAIAKDRNISYKSFQYWIDQRKKGKAYLIIDEKIIIIASPYDVVWDGEHFFIYLAIAHEGKTIIDVQLLDNMEDIKIHNSPRKGGNSVQNFLKLESNIQEISFFPRQFKIKATNELVSSIIDKFRNNVRITPLDNNFFTATIDSTLTPDLFLWILEFGPDAEIIFPEDAQARLTYYILELLNGNPPFREENAQDVE